MDAQAIIDLHAWGKWKTLIHACNIGVTSIIKKETKYYKLQEKKRSIDLNIDIKAGLIQEIEVSNGDLIRLREILNPPFSLSLDSGEQEAIAFIFGVKRDFRFCSADGLAIKCLGALGLRNNSVSLEEVFEQKKINYKLPRQYSKNFSESMLAEGLRESHLYVQRKPGEFQISVSRKKEASSSMLP